MCIKYNHGYNDGKLSATSLQNPIHNNWKRDKSGRVIHFNKKYLKGYIQGYIDNSKGIYPFCLKFNN